MCVGPRGKAGGGSDGLHPRSKIQVRNREQVLHSGETDVGGGNDQIDGKAAITAPLTLGYLVLGNLGAARLNPPELALPTKMDPKLRFHPSAECVTDPV